MAQPPPGIADDAEFSRSVRLGEELRIRYRDHVVVGSMQQEQRARREGPCARHRVNRRDLAGKCVEIAGRGLRTKDAHAATVPSEPTRVPRPIREIGGRAQRRDPTHPRFGRTDSERERAAHSRAEDPGTSGLRDLQYLLHRKADIRVPPSDGEVTCRSARASEVEREDPPTSLSRDPIRELREGQPRGERPPGRGGKVMTQHQCRHGPRRRWVRPVRGQRGPVWVFDVLIHSSLLGRLPLSWVAVTPLVTKARALKEWAAVVQALLVGEQVLDIRKGGLREDGRHFSIHSSRVWLYPTVEHQKPELLKPAYQRWVASTTAAAPPDRAIRVEGWADIVGVATVTEPEILDALDGKVIWSRDYVESRFRWKARDPLVVLALRVHRLTEPITIAFRDEYGGCTSWVDLDGLPDPDSVASAPALSDTAFDARLKSAAAALPGGFALP